MIDGMSEESVVAKTWRMLLERHPEARRGFPEMIEAAFAEPRLRQLYPFPSHGGLHFHRFMWSNDLPFMVKGEETYSVYAARYAGLLGEVATPQEAAALVVANLPSDCVAAVDGPCPESSSSPH
ncbi:DUF6193 family natural product biosynthesis protein [Streptomyces sp. NPDC096097]|uniref:DUF6193 family natural product biosynthesis protein n=1 Tax=Streptomyces sp. NPDC096097 TaxID=3155546 RepID=UPI00331ED674